MDQLLEVLSREFNRRITKETIAKLGWAKYFGTILVWFKEDEEDEVILTAADLDLDKAFEFLELWKA